MNRLVLLQPDVIEIGQVLLACAPSESGCFLLLREGRGTNGRRLLASDPIFPAGDAWDVQASDQLKPSARWVSAAVSRAIAANAGLLFVHTHPDPRYPIDFSPADHDALGALAETIGPLLPGPFAAAVFGPRGWKASVMTARETSAVEQVVSLGRTLRVLDPAADVGRSSDSREVNDRQRDALGVVHEQLGRLHIAVVGLGGLGSPIAEQLVRMGLGRVTLIDDDVLDTPSNLRRLFGSTMADLRATTPPAKVDVVGRHLDQLGLDVPVRRIKGDVRDETVFRELLDADVVICATDTHGSRALLNDLVSSYFLPVIDVGVQGGAKRNGHLAALTAEVRVLTPTTPCLWCRGAISADVIRAENLPREQAERLGAEGYLVGGVGRPAPSVVALTVLGAGLATCALLALLSDEGDVCPSGYIVDGLMGDSIEPGPVEPSNSCRCRQRLGLGDTESPA